MLDLQRYFAFCHVFKEIPRIYQRMPTWVTPSYRRSLIEHARTFGLTLSAERSNACVS